MWTVYDNVHAVDLSIPANGLVAVGRSVRNLS